MRLRRTHEFRVGLFVGRDRMRGAGLMGYFDVYQTGARRMDRFRAWLESRVARNLALALLVVLLLARVPYAGTHMGLSRDLFVAWRIVHGEAFPLYGPVLNDTIHLGPVWFYVMATLLAIGRTWFGTVFLIGLLASSQIPLAYLVGKALHSRRAGLLFAVGLVVPNWSTIEWLLPSHPLLSIPCDLAFLLCALRYWRRPRLRYLCGLALAFVLALHAHPANAGLVWIGLALLVWAWRKGSLRLRDVGLAGALALLPLLPFFYWDATQGFRELHGAGNYLGEARSTGSPWNVVRLFSGVAYGGTREWFGHLLGWQPRLALVATIVTAAGGVLGALGLVAMARDPQRRHVLAIAVLATLAVLLTTVSLRDLTPYYMAASSWLMLAGLVACGLASLGDARWAHVARFSSATIAVAACVLTLHGSARFQTRGAWQFSWWPLFDIKRDPDPNGVTLLLMPAYAQDGSGRFLCAQSAASAHGELASELVSDYAMPMRITCARSDVHVGGNEPERQHWLGLSRALFASIDVEPSMRLGPMGIVPARPLGEMPPMPPPPDEPIYPVRMPPQAAGDVHRLGLQLRPTEHLAISNLAFGFAGWPELTVVIQGRVVTPRASDGIVAVYECAECAAGAFADATITARGGNYAGIDIVAF
jgi:hypothetical protein